MIIEREEKKLSNLEEKTLKIMQDIFITLSHEEEIEVDKYFASDMLKVNNRSCIYPCFIGYNSTTIVIIKLNSQLEKEGIQYIDSSNIKSVSIKKSFLSKFIKIKINCEDNTVFTAGAPYKLKYVPIQQENIEDFMEIFQNQNR